MQQYSCAGWSASQLHFPQINKGLGKTLVYFTPSIECFESLTKLISDAEQTDALIVVACLVTSADAFTHAFERYGTRLEVHSVYLNRELLRHPVLSQTINEDSVTQAFFSQTDFKYL